MPDASSSPVLHNLLAHALANDCTDPDCELHNIVVALEEEVIDSVSAAYFLAGMAANQSKLTREEVVASIVKHPPFNRG